MKQQRLTRWVEPDTKRPHRQDVRDGQSPYNEELRRRLRLKLRAPLPEKFLFHYMKKIKTTDYCETNEQMQLKHLKSDEIIPSRRVVVDPAAIIASRV